MMQWIWHVDKTVTHSHSAAFTYAKFRCWRTSKKVKIPSIFSFLHTWLVTVTAFWGCFLTQQALCVKHSDLLTCNTFCCLLVHLPKICFFSTKRWHYLPVSPTLYRCLHQCTGFNGHLKQYNSHLCSLECTSQLEVLLLGIQPKFFSTPPPPICRVF